MIAFFLEFADVVRPALKRTPVFVTGGFQTGASMVKAIKNGSTDGIGIARATCEEPHLPKYLISGKVLSKVDTKIDYNDFFTCCVLAACQMRRIGFGLETVDSSNENVVKQLLHEMHAFFSLLGQKLSEGVVISGNPSLGGPRFPWENYEL